MNVYLDDIRKCPAGFVPAKTSEECIWLLQEGPVQILSLDFHLGWGEPSGFEVVKFMVEHQVFADRIFLHSSDPMGRLQMYQHLYAYKPAHVQIMNHAMPAELLEQINHK